VAAEESPQRLFTVAEANAHVPAMAARIDALRALRDEVRRGRELLDILWKRLETGEAVLSAIGEQQASLDHAAEQFVALVSEVQELGIILRDLDSGLVDFPAAVRGIPIYLCWRMGEARVAFWHGIADGFAGRKPISTILDASARGPS
jgi:hypothetical protein